MKIPATCFVCILWASAWAQTGSKNADSARMLVDSTLAFAKKYSLYRDKADWPVITDSVHAAAAGAKNIPEAIPSLQLLFRMLGDHHGAVVYNGKFYRWNEKKPPLDSMVYKSLLKKYYTDNTVECRILEKGYGYLLIPDNNPTQEGDVALIARQIRDSLDSLHPETLKGLIIDLRVNPGGNMYAMIGGVMRLFAPGKLGAFVDPAGHTEEAWGIRNDTVYAGTSPQYDDPQGAKSLADLKVVVLIGPETKSSGEATAISFIGRKNTLLTGENTGGYTTSNASFQFTATTGVFVASAIEADRNGTVYWDVVKPDLLVAGGDNFEDWKADKKIRAALDWLQHAPKSSDR